MRADLRISGPMLKPDYSDAAFPYWRLGMEPEGR
jgi:hypothetical protein